MQEFEIISRYFAPLSYGIEGALSLKDDGAVIDLGGEQMMIVTSDACVEGIHFPEKTPSKYVAQRALRSNLSDLAAMGAIPVAYSHTIMLPRSVDEAWIEGYSQGLKRDQETYKISMIGGDTVATTGPITISIMAIGRTQKGKELKRCDARSGDRIYLTGPVGDAYIGLKVLQGQFKGLSDEDKDYFKERFYLPTPRIEEVNKIKSYANAAIDISDGLLGDLSHICRESNLHAFMDKTRIPFSRPAKRLLDSLPEKKAAALFKEMLTSGDDYELALSLSPDRCGDAEFVAQTHRFAIYHIGHLGPKLKDESEEDSVTVVDEKGVPQKFVRVGYQHSW